VNFTLFVLRDDTIAEITKNGSEKIIRSANNATALTSVSRYASFTKIAFVEKQIAPKTQIIIPLMKYFR
jgi:hypothetical protein